LGWEAALQVQAWPLAFIVSATGIVSQACKTGKATPAMFRDDTSTGT
jgi:hypothetical protein